MAKKAARRRSAVKRYQVFVSHATKDKWLARTRKSYDLFISHSFGDANLATEIADTCRASGVTAIAYGELLPGKDVSDALWEALAESRAVLAILSPAGPTPSMAIELGAARAWNKPIFVLVTDPSLNGLPVGFSGVHLYPVGRVEDVIKAMKTSGDDLTDDNRVVLARLFAGAGVSVDQLAFEPTILERLVRDFNAHTGKVVSGERLLSELLRMRKQGKLSKVHHMAQAKSRRGTG